MRQQKKMAKIPKSDQSRNTNRKYKPEKQMGHHGPPEMGSGAQEE
jgi:hypothetical protein